MKIEMDGLEAVLQNLSRMNVDESTENRALTKAGNLTKESIISEAPVDKRSPEDGGTLKRNIRLRRPKDGEAIIHTGGAFHAHLVEFGRSGGSATTKKGKKVVWGPTSANPFFSRGFEQSKNEAMQAMVSELQKGLKL